MTRSSRLALVIFAVTMGIFEGAAVVYLNRLQALGEFAGLSSPMSSVIVVTEVLREAASIVMIVAVAAVAARGFIPRLARTAIIFGIWDIVYYIVLRVLIGFPATLLTWDVLFLIPKPWVGPVAAPILVSIALVTAGWIAILREKSAGRISPHVWHWALAVAGGLVVIGSFLIDTPAAFDGTNFPARFRWEVFLPGFALGLAAFVSAARRQSPSPDRIPASKRRSRWQS